MIIDMGFIRIWYSLVILSLLIFLIIIYVKLRYNVLVAKRELKKLEGEL